MTLKEKYAYIDKQFPRKRHGWIRDDPSDEEKKWK